MKKNHVKRAAALILAAGFLAILPACGPQREENTRPSEAALQAPRASSATIVDTEQKGSKEDTPAATSFKTNDGEKQRDNDKRSNGHENSVSKNDKAVSQSNAPISTKPPEVANVPEPISESTPAPIPTSEPEPVFEWADSSYGSAVCEGVNEVRAMYGLPALSYGGSGGLEGEAEEMARAGSIWGASSRRSVSRSNDGGKTMGIFSATHAAEIGQGNYSTLYVASVKYNGTRYTIVEAR